MNGATKEFHIWFDGFCAALGDEKGLGLDPFQWEALRARIDTMLLIGLGFEPDLPRRRDTVVPRYTDLPETPDTTSGGSI